MLLKITGSDMYVHQIRGVCFVTFVTGHNIDDALVFPEDKVSHWIDMLSDMSGVELESVEVSRIPVNMHYYCKAIQHRGE